MAQPETAKKKFKEQPFMFCSMAFLCSMILMLVTPRIPQPKSYHDFADQRRFFGIPHSMNVITSLPFFFIGIIGLILCLDGKHVCLSIRGEVWTWVSFYIGILTTTFGSAYYHLKPNDTRLVWDRLPMSVALLSLMAVFVIERVDEGWGTISLIPFVLAGIISVITWWLTDDMRPYGLTQSVPSFAIPLMTIALPSKYTHSIYWLLASGLFFLGRTGELMDNTVFKLTNYYVSGHTLKHVFGAMAPAIITLMLAQRKVKTERQSLWEKWQEKLHEHKKSQKSH